MDPISLGLPESIGENDLDGVRIRFPFTLWSSHSTINGTITIIATGGDLEWSGSGSSINSLQNEILLNRFRAIALKELEFRSENNYLNSKKEIEIKYRQ